MELSQTEIIERPISEVYALVRDDLQKIVPFLPNVDKIEVKEHNEKDETHTEVVNHWYGKVDMPSLLKKFVGPEIFSWKDIACWNNESHYVDFQLQSFLANDLFEARGRNTFIDAGEGKTKIEITCSIKIYPEKVPGIPRLLAKKVKPAIEGILEKLIGPNLTSLGTGLKEYYSQN